MKRFLILFLVGGLMLSAVPIASGQAAQRPVSAAHQGETEPRAAARRSRDSEAVKQLPGRPLECYVAQSRLCRALCEPA